MTKLMDERCRAILADVLEQTQGSVDGLNVKPYRLDHIDEIERLDSLIRKHLLVIEHAEDTLRVGSMGLYFIQGATRDALLADIDRVLDHLREQYRQTLGDRVRLADIAATLDLGRNRVEECVAYIDDAMALGLSPDPSDGDAYVFPTEPLFHFDRFEDFLAERAGHWFPELFKNEEPESAHGNVEASAAKRELILGAALWVINNNPDKCRRGERLSGERIVSQIELNITRWWPDAKKAPAHRTMVDLINKFL